MDYVKDMDPEKRRRVLLEGAKRSGTPITVYTGMGENDVNRLSQAFERDIDDVSLEMWRAEGDIQLYTRAINEFRSNTPRADVINMKFNHSYDFNKECRNYPDGRRCQNARSNGCGKH